MQNSTASSNRQSGPLIANNFSYSKTSIKKSICQISQHYDVTCISEKQKTALSKELFDAHIINAIEHAILSLPLQSIQDSFSKVVSPELPLDLVAMYRYKVSLNKNKLDLSPAKAIDEKFLFIMSKLSEQHNSGC